MPAIKTLRNLQRPSAMRTARNGLRRFAAFPGTFALPDTRVSGAEMPGRRGARDTMRQPCRVAPRPSFPDAMRVEQPLQRVKARAIRLRPRPPSAAPPAPAGPFRAARPPAPRGPAACGRHRVAPRAPEPLRSPDPGLRGRAPDARPHRRCATAEKPGRFQAPAQAADAASGKARLAVHRVFQPVLIQRFQIIAQGGAGRYPAAAAPDRDPAKSAQAERAPALAWPQARPARCRAQPQQKSLGLIVQRVADIERGDAMRFAASRPSGRNARRAPPPRYPDFGACPLRVRIWAASPAFLAKRRLGALRRPIPCASHDPRSAPPAAPAPARLPTAPEDASAPENRRRPTPPPHRAKARQAHPSRRQSHVPTRPASTGYFLPRRLVTWRLWQRPLCVRRPLPQGWLRARWGIWS